MAGFHDVLRSKTVAQSSGVYETDGTHTEKNCRLQVSKIMTTFLELGRLVTIAQSYGTLMRTNAAEGKFRVSSTPTGRS